MKKRLLSRILRDFKNPREMLALNGTLSKLHVIVADIETVVHPLSLEPWIACPLGEKVPERRLEMKKRLLGRILRDFKNPRETFSLDGVELFLESQSRGLTARFVFLLPVLESPIPHEASNTAGAP